MIGRDGRIDSDGSYRLFKGDTYELFNGTQIDGVVFVVDEVLEDKQERWYKVRANKSHIFLPDQHYYISQEAIDAYNERGQIRDAIRECAI